MRCASCNEELREDAKFCPHCGAEVAPEKADAPPADKTSERHRADAGPRKGQADDGSTKKKGVVVAAVVVLSVAVAAVIAFASGYMLGRAGDATQEPSTVKAAASSTESAASVEVPDVLGCSLSDAESLLEDAGFMPMIANQYDESDDNKGKVIEQKPEAGEWKTEGSFVTIKISLGKKEEPAAQSSFSAADEAPSEQERIELMITRYVDATALMQDGEKSWGGVSSVAPGSPDVDAQLVYDFFAWCDYEDYGLEATLSGHETSVSSASAASLIRSFYGNAPSDMSYLADAEYGSLSYDAANDSFVLPMAGGEMGLYFEPNLLVPDGDRLIATGEVYYEAGDSYVCDARFTLLKDDESVFGYHLMSAERTN